MASLHKDPRGKSPFFYCAFTLPDGRRTFRSTKLTERKKALEVCLQWEKAAEQGRGGSFTEAQARKVLNTILESTGQGPMQTETIQDYFTNWLSGKELAKKPRTAERYGIVIKKFLANLGQSETPAGRAGGSRLRELPQRINVTRQSAQDRDSGNQSSPHGVERGASAGPYAHQSR